MTETQYQKFISEYVAWELNLWDSNSQKKHNIKAYLPAVGNDALVATVLVFPLRIRDGRVGTAMTDTLL